MLNSMVIKFGWMILAIILMSGTVYVITSKLGSTVPNVHEERGSDVATDTIDVPISPSNTDVVSKHASVEVPAEVPAVHKVPSPKVSKPVSDSALAVPKSTVESADRVLPLFSTVVAENTAFELDPLWRDALVNLYCVVSGSDDVVSGSGVIIDRRGIILTNAHVGMSFLFSAVNAPSLYECTVRIGSPAEPRYRAELLYIPAGWIDADIAQFGKTDDKNYVYGKQDYALLYITATINARASLPSSFPFMQTENIVPAKGTPVYILGYPASYLGATTVVKDLYLISSHSFVDAIKPIDMGTGEDVMAFKGTIAGQHGTSGGAIVESGGKFVGIPTYYAEEFGNTTDDNVLHAITIAYIDADLKKSTGYSLKEFSRRTDLASLSVAFMAGEGKKYQRLYADEWEKRGYVIPGVSY